MNDSAAKNRIDSYMILVVLFHLGEFIIIELELGGSNGHDFLEFFVVVESGDGELLGFRIGDSIYHFYLLLVYFN